jgi:hypothetical protein
MAEGMPERMREAAALARPLSSAAMAVLAFLVGLGLIQAVARNPAQGPGIAASLCAANVLVGLLLAYTLTGGDAPAGGYGEAGSHSLWFLGASLLALVASQLAVRALLPLWPVVVVLLAMPVCATVQLGCLWVTYPDFREDGNKSLVLDFGGFVLCFSLPPALVAIAAANQ